MNVGILGIGVYLPIERMTAEDIAEKASLPIEVVKTKMGIIEKRVAGQDDHTVQMAIRAARNAINHANIDGKEIDVIIYFGEEHKEYPLWTAGIKIQEEIGATNAWAFDIQLRCGTAILAMKLAKSLMHSDENIRTVLLAGGYRNHDLIDYRNERTRFMFNLGAGGGALILKRDSSENLIYEADIMTDGSFSEDVIVPVGGTRQPLTAEHIMMGLYRLDVTDPQGMKTRLEQRSLDNFIKVIRNSLTKSGFHEKELAYIGMLHMKRSAHDFVLRTFHLKEENSIYLSNYGHIGQIDQILSLQLALNEKRIQDGDVLTLVSAGIGYAWGAITIQWGKQRGRRDDSL
ncbi:3-oxoacyl-ACP synthase [Ureibacillus aquaedulcis]|uniref:3-oxoacyl-ACP synthase n=1 Tax=Ureibacillus aquaedulcis TaxID=3058421 RepID=A0ABT8GR86_9BACL|nr:3-oxoacyl-ACP synthase [Ureibacillus sp. BA0131]MDN4493816.1 3-oxoacyl-ACP synthase [Ureibacillus sp. BA0131]